jgi:hypothetical protein
VEEQKVVLVVNTLDAKCTEDAKSTTRATFAKKLDLLEMLNFPLKRHSLRWQPMPWILVVLVE